MAFIGVTGSFKAGRRASTYSSAAWSPSTLGNDLRMWLNPSDTSTTTLPNGSNALTSTDARKYYRRSSHNRNINNTPQQGTEDNKEIVVFDLCPK